ncbi:MAG: hypothetical protein ACE5IY_01115 [bacterium]
MNDMFALTGSIAIGGLFLLSVMRFYGGLVEHAQEKTYELMAQESTASLMEIIESDFRKMGSGLPVSLPPIVANPDSSDITFWADLNEDGAPELVRYYTSLPSDTDAAATQNPNDFILYRVVDGVNTVDTPAGVVGFSVRLLDELAAVPADLSEVRMLDVSLTVESLYAYDEKYPRVVWNKRIVPQNLVKISDTDFD